MLHCNRYNTSERSVCIDSRHCCAICLHLLQVGGVYTCKHQEQAEVTADDGSDSGSSSCSPWSESSAGLCKDIQSVQRDPWSSKRLYAVAGSGSLPGGLYRSRGWGQKWKRLFGYRWVQ